MTCVNVSYCLWIERIVLRETVVSSKRSFVENRIFNGVNAERWTCNVYIWSKIHFNISLPMRRNNSLRFTRNAEKCFSSSKHQNKITKWAILRNRNHLGGQFVWQIPKRKKIHPKDRISFHSPLNHSTRTLNCYCCRQSLACWYSTVVNGQLKLISWFVLNESTTNNRNKQHNSIHSNPS